MLCGGWTAWTARRSAITRIPEERGRAERQAARRKRSARKEALENGSGDEPRHHAALLHGACDGEDASAKRLRCVRLHDGVVGGFGRAVADAEREEQEQDRRWYVAQRRDTNDACGDSKPERGDSVDDAACHSAAEELAADQAHGYDANRDAVTAKTGSVQREECRQRRVQEPHGERRNGERRDEPRESPALADEPERLHSAFLQLVRGFVVDSELVWGESAAREDRVEEQSGEERRRVGEKRRDSAEACGEQSSGDRADCHDRGTGDCVQGVAGVETLRRQDLRDKARRRGIGR